MNLRFGVIVACLAASCLGSAQVVLNQVDDFSNLSTSFWSGGTGPTVVATGGPAGVGDAFLQLTSVGGFGPGSHLAAHNGLQWSGNYSGVGVKFITMDLKNFGSTTVNMRLVFIDDFQQQWTTSNANSFSISPNSGWISVRFTISEPTWVNVGSTIAWNQLIGAVPRLMIRHDAGNPQGGGEPIVATLGVDNIRAIDSILVSPSGYTVDLGLNLGGTLASLQSSDNNSVLVLNDEFDSTGQVTITGLTDFLAPGTVKVTLESGASRTDLTEFLACRNYAQNNWTNIVIRNTTLADSVEVGNVTANASQHVSAGGELRVRVLWIPQQDIVSADGWGERIDLLKWNLSP